MIDLSTIPDPPANAPRVLCFSPYNWWQLHAAWEMTILAALKMRGIAVDYLMCDGQMPMCDVRVRPGNRHPDYLVCSACQADVARFAADMGMTWHWLGRYISTEQRRTALAWAHSLAPTEFSTAVYNHWPIGPWSVSSIHTYFRVNQLQEDDPVIAEAHRKTLAAGLITAMALDKLMDETRPDHVFIFNGRVTPLRVCRELARRRQLPVIVHERGQYRKNTIFLRKYTDDQGFDTNLQAVRDHWQSVPLSPDQLQAITDYLNDRRQGRNIGWYPLSPPPQNRTQVLEYLKLTGDKPIWSLYMSSVDEIYGLLDESDAAYRNPEQWVLDTIDFARHHQQIDLVLRAHPNSKPHPKARWNHRDLAFCQQIQTQLPDNVRLVMPDEPVSSYTLMDLSTVGLTFVTTVGLEMAAVGTHVVPAGDAGYRNTPFTRTPVDPSDYRQILKQLTQLSPGHRDRQIRRDALRFFYGLAFRVDLDMPLVDMPTPTSPEIRWSQTRQIAPGAEPALDRICNIILTDEPVCPLPNEHDNQPDAETEAQWLEDHPIPTG